MFFDKFETRRVETSQCLRIGPSINR